MFREEPDALLVEEIFVEQGTDRTNVDDVPGERIFQRIAGKTSISA